MGVEERGLLFSAGAVGTPTALPFFVKGREQARAGERAAGQRADVEWGGRPAGDRARAPGLRRAEGRRGGGGAFFSASRNAAVSHEPNA